MAAPQAAPEKIARSFFQGLMSNQFHYCWSLFSQKTQQEFLKYTHQAIFDLHGHAAKSAGLGLSEIKFMFESPDPSLTKTLFNVFWKRFYFQSNTHDFFRFGYFDPAEVRGKEASVPVRIVYPDGRQVNVSLTMVFQRGNWRFGYIESGLPF